MSEISHFKPQHEVGSEPYFVSLNNREQAETLLAELARFPELHHQRIADTLIQMEQWGVLAEHLDRFRSLHHKTAQQLINNWHGEAVAKQLDSFRPEEHQAIVDLFFEAEQGHVLADGLSHLKNVPLQQVANRMILVGQGEAFVQQLPELRKIEHTPINIQEIADRLFLANQGWVIAEHLPLFEGVSHQDIGNRLINQTQGWALMNNLEKFQHVSYAEFANRLILQGEAELLLRHFDRPEFSALSHDEIILRCLSSKQGRVIAEHITRFPPALHPQIVDRLFAYNQEETIAYFLPYFVGLNHQELFERLLTRRQHKHIAQNLSHFQGIDHQQFAMYLIDQKEPRLLLSFFHRFSDLDHSRVAKELIKQNYLLELAEFGYLFPDLDFKEIINSPLQTRHNPRINYHLIVKFLPFVSKDQHPQIFNTLISTQHMSFELLSHLPDFHLLDANIAQSLFHRVKHNQEFLRCFADKLFVFQSIHEKTAHLLIDHGQGSAVAKFVSLIEPQAHQRIVDHLSRRGEVVLVGHHLPLFQQIDHQILVDRLLKPFSIIIPEYERRQMEVLSSNLPFFKGVNLTPIIDTLLKNGYEDLIVKYFPFFDELDEQSFVNQLFEKNKHHLLLENLSSFSKVDLKFLYQKLWNEGQFNLLIQHVRAFHFLSTVQKEELFSQAVAVDKFNVLDAIAKYTAYSEGISHQRIVHCLLQKGYDIRVLQHLKHFRQLSPETAIQLLESARQVAQVDGYGGDYFSCLVENLSSFENLPFDFFQRLVAVEAEFQIETEVGAEDGLAFYVCKYIQHFRPSDHDAIARALLHTGEHFFLSKNIEHFSGLTYETMKIFYNPYQNTDFLNSLSPQKVLHFFGVNYQEYAKTLLTSSREHNLIYDFQLTRGLDPQEWAIRLIGRRDGKYVVSNLDRFQPVNYNSILDALFLLEEYEAIAEHVQKFYGIDSNEIADRLREKDRMELIAKYLPFFEKQHHLHLAEDLIESGKGEIVAHYIKHFQTVFHQRITELLYEHQKGFSVAEYLENFKGLSEHIARRLIQDGHAKRVSLNLSSFQHPEHVKTLTQPFVQTDNTQQSPHRRPVKAPRSPQRKRR